MSFNVVSRTGWLVVGKPAIDFVTWCPRVLSYELGSPHCLGSEACDSLSLDFARLAEGEDE